MWWVALDENSRYRFEGISDGINDKLARALADLREMGLAYRELEKSALSYAGALGEITGKLAFTGSMSDQLRELEQVKQAHLSVIRDLTAAWGEQSAQWTASQTSAFEAVQRAIRETEHRINALALNAASGVVDALDEALRNLHREEEARLAEERGRIEEGIRSRHARELEGIQSLKTARLSAISAEIRAVDELLRRRESEAAGEEELKKIGRLRARIAYEPDEENRQALQAQLEQLEKARADRLYREELERKKEALRAQQEAVRQSYDALAADTRLQQERELAAFRELQQKKLTEIELYEEKKALIERAKASGSMDEIIALIAEYAPMYAAAGTDLGASLLEGVSSELLVRMPELVAQALDGLNPESETGQATIVNAGLLGRLSGERFAEMFAAQVKSAVQGVSAAVSAAGTESPGYVDQSRTTTIQVTSPTPITYAQAIREAYRADREQQIRGL